MMSFIRQSSELADFHLQSTTINDFFGSVIDTTIIVDLQPHRQIFNSFEQGGGGAVHRLLYSHPRPGQDLDPRKFRS